MNFNDAIKKFEEELACTDAFVILKKDMGELIKENSNFSAVYLIIYKISRSHHLLYEDQAVSPENSSAAKEQMLGYLQALKQPINDGDVAKAYKVLSDISYDYFVTDKILGI
ncbi:hypothetical protein [Vibrio sp. MA40-2]|uniref:hypothetical protein n=1 Tax=Vibrio sp. MA40-2 TaxID=3391828 RepID=UPI0039A66317